MSLLDKITDKANGFFAKPKEPPRKAFEDSAATPQERKIAAHERQLQHRDLNRDSAATHVEDIKAARAKTAREHPQPKNKPGWASVAKSRLEIERDAKKIVAAAVQVKKDAIDGKSLRQLIGEAAIRAGKDRPGPYKVMTRWTPDIFQKGTVEPGRFSYQAKVENGPQPDGIQEGTISKLSVRNRENQQIASYDKGWNHKPALGSAAEAVTQAIVDFYNRYQKQLPLKADEVIRPLADADAVQRLGRTLPDDPDPNQAGVFQKGDRPAATLTEAEKAELVQAAERGDLAETAHQILQPDEAERYTPDERASRVAARVEVVEAVQAGISGEALAAVPSDDYEAVFAARVAEIEAEQASAALTRTTGGGRTM